MNSLQTSLDSAVQPADVLDKEFADRQLTLVASADLPTVSGPLSVTTLGPADDPDGPALVVVAAAADAGMEVFDLAVQAATAANPDLVAATAMSIAGLDEIDTSSSGPVDIFALSKDGVVVGAVLRQVDRRQPTPTESPATAGFADAGPTQPRTGGAAPLGDLSMLRDVALDVTVELGRQSLTLSQMLNLTVGSVVELDRPAGAPVDIRVNGVLFGKGEVVVVDDEYAVRIIELFSPEMP